jgi:adenosine deaminase
MEDAAADSCYWLEIQIDPTPYAELVGGLEILMELLIDSAVVGTQSTGVGLGLIVAASWASPPSKAERLALLAARYRDHGVTGFGISNDERLSRPRDYLSAFRIAWSAEKPVIKR